MVTGDVTLLLAWELLFPQVPGTKSLCDSALGCRALTQMDMAGDVSVPEEILHRLELREF